MILTLLLLININRTTPLVNDPKLQELAQVRASQIYQSQDFSHTGWKKSFENTSCGYIGENLAKDFPNALAINEAMLKSPTHKANMLSTKYKTIGIGNYKNITVELFCDKNLKVV